MDEKNDPEVPIRHDLRQRPVSLCRDRATLSDNAPTMQQIEAGSIVQSADADSKQNSSTLNNPSKRNMHRPDEAAGVLPLLSSRPHQLQASKGRGDGSDNQQSGRGNASNVNRNPQNRQSNRGRERNSAIIAAAGKKFATAYHPSSGFQSRNSQAGRRFNDPNLNRLPSMRQHQKPRQRHALIDILHELSQDTNENVVMTLANAANKFEELIKMKLELEDFKRVLALLKKVCQSDFDKNKSLVISQACQPEFLRQFNTFLLQGFSVPEDELDFLLSDMIYFFESVVRLLPLTACDLLKSDVVVIHACVNGLQANGTVTVKENTLLRLEAVVNNLTGIQDTNKNCNIKRESNKERMQFGQPPEPFRDINIYPNTDDVTQNYRPFLRPNVVKGRYFDVEHYLDIQFRLLREDFLRPLREGIADYVRGGQSTRKCEAPSVRIYKDVKFLEYVSEEVETAGQRPREGTLLSFGIQSKKPIDWDHSKRFMYGSLLCFSNNHFETLMFATVCERDVSFLSQGQLLVKFCEKYDENIFSNRNPYVMVESEVYFEPYFQVLKTLKTFDNTSFPMVKYIVEMTDEDSPPHYLLPSEPEDPPVICFLEHKKENYKVTVLDKSTWPSAEQLGLDESQYNALYSALTNELVVIQGPPGTGKTFMALRIVETLLSNKMRMNHTTPILVVCLTNHALDQFLVGILEMGTTENITRIGGQSRCSEMDRFNLRRRNRTFSSASADLYSGLRCELDDLRSKIYSLKRCIHFLQSKDGVFLFPDFFAALSKTIHSTTNLSRYEPTYFKWLFGDNILIAPSDLTQDADNFYSFASMRTYLQKWVSDENEAIEKESSYGYDASYIDFAKRQMRDNIDLIWKLIQNLEYQLKQQKPPNEERVTQMLQKNLLKLYPTERLQLYSYWAQQHEINCQNQLQKYSNEIRQVNERLEELRFQDDLELLRDSDVVGMTTNGAARQHSMLQMLKCKIVIVEEAAEVMESHIISCLTNHCQHLILIGDHKQLRPSIAVYELGRHYDFDVSLFERFVRNRGQCETLSVQHRMAPSLATLITPTIYPTLINDKSVLERLPVNGLPHRLFFVTHNELEQQDSEISSRRNEHEALFLLALCNHLVLQGYEGSQITILATYKGQMFFIKKEKKKNELLENVNVTVVDNFQGEENDIILLSLVRSNTEGRIGFLATENRVCVALSRARQGLYIIGNMDILSEASDIWKKVKSSLLDQEGLGPALSLRCQVHPDQTHQVSTAEDFKRYAPEGGCTKICTVVLDCGHSCNKVCHALKRDHTNIKCNPKNPCTRLCVAGLHVCKKRCVEDCGDCTEIVTKMLPCKHEQSMACSRDPKKFSCPVLVDKNFEACNHKATVCCSVKQCPCLCEIRLPCGHQCVNNCHPNDDPDHMKYKCKKTCTKLNKNCKEDHDCPKLCCEPCLECFIQVERTAECGHTFEMNCSDDPEKIKCKNKCKRILTCGHWCKRKCFETCDPCKEKVLKKIESCQHSVQLLCSEEAVREHCVRKCERLLPCGHPCTKKCAEPCSNKCVVRVDKVTGLCGHDVSLMCWEKANGLHQPKDISRCHKPCKQMLVCGHECKGDCNSCSQGRCHLPCKENCTNTLVCGHRCTGLCNAVCFMCQRQCESKCSHGQRTCQLKCSVQCLDHCKRPCGWKCEHHKCTRPCGMICNRPACNEPCKKKLHNCGHPCSGLCGEICPKLCWTCDRDILTAEAFMQGAELTDNPKFVYLPDCHHTLEVQNLECWLKWQSSNLCLLTCPRCETPITSLPRYKALIKQVYTDFSRIQHKIFSRQNDINKKTFDLKNELAQLKPLAAKYLNENVQILIEHALKTLQRQNKEKRGMYDDILFATAVESIAIITSVISSIFSAVELHGINVIENVQNGKVQAIIYFILNVMNSRIKNFSMQVAQDLNLELKRLHHIIQVLNYIQQKPMTTGSSDDNENLLQQIFNFKRYTVEMQQESLEMLKSKGISNIEECNIKIEIPYQPLKSLWLKCSQNHFTFIQFIPQPKSLNCEKCKTPLLIVEPPVFKKAKIGETSSASGIPKASDNSSAGAPNRMKPKNNSKAGKKTTKDVPTTSQIENSNEPNQSKGKRKKSKNKNKNKKKSATSQKGAKK